uniref:RNA-directed RNA polymerase n=1 Tax=Middle Point orbivirus TaxID=464979 RepID=A0A8K1YKA0_9REOV|nr:VP1 [Middle Point orbivirus]
MAVVVHRQRLTQNAAARILPGIHFNQNEGTTYYYKYSQMQKDKSKRTNNERKEMDDNDFDPNKGFKTLYALPVLRETSWVELISSISLEEYSEDIFELLVETAVESDKLDPEEEFLQNYKINSFLQPNGTYARAFDFVMSRARDECQVYGDVALKHWVALLIELSKTENFTPLGLQVMARFIQRFGEPFHQNTRDLSQVKDEVFIVTVALIFEMCITESFSEFNALFRTKEEKIGHYTFAKKTFQLYDIVRELFRLCLPYPKYINNKLRAVYSWFVKCWGVAAEEIIVLKSHGGDDRNSKQVDYVGFEKFKNPYSIAIRKSKFFAESKKENIQKVQDMLDLVKERSSQNVQAPLIMHFLNNVYEESFNPTEISHVILASYMLSIQTLTGYGRAWIKNKGDDPEKMLKPDKNNFVTRLSDMTENFVMQAYREAEEHGHTIVPPESMYSALLRMAKNTSSGMSTSVEVPKTYGPKAEKQKTMIRIVSRQKALVLMQEGDKIYKRENMIKKFDSIESYQSKGQRDVPIKATRIIYSIHISVLAPQLLLTLPINEYFSQTGGSTRPNAREIGGKVIIGDLESTGSRVIDASDTFRNTADQGIFTLALDYSEYDQHMTPDNFRLGMMNGMRRALSKYHSLRYEGMTVDDLLEAGYGKGRLVGSFWNGRRHVKKMLLTEYQGLDERDRVPTEDSPFKFSPPGVHLIRNLELVKGEVKEGDDYVLVSPWDGSDLAKVSTHLSGENTTLVWNSVHNLAAGTIIQEELASKAPRLLTVESETYVGDDMLMYTNLNVIRGDAIDKIMETIFETIALFGHEASPAKTTFLPFSAEKTQTHAKQGVYIGQDRMMFISSERKKDIEDVKSYMRANVNVFITKCSRGFSAELAHIILCFKTIFVGYRKFKRTIMENGKLRSRHFDSAEDGYTLCVLRHPLTLYLPVEWNGYGAHPSALNVIMTPEIFLDSLLMDSFRDEILPIMKICTSAMPSWNETQVDKRRLTTTTKMSLFSKLARRPVSTVLQHPEARAKVQMLPLQGFGPTEISGTMMHSALLKEPKARTLLSPNYELDFHEVFNTWKKEALLRPQGIDLQISMQYCKIFEVVFENERNENTARQYFPDLNLSPEFKNQKLVIGNRKSNRKRISYVDQIDSILRSDVIMRGFITSNHILAVLEEIGIGHSAEDYALIFSMMNLDEKVCEKLGNYIARDKIKFDAQKLNKGGACGDEFSMSLDVCTQQMIDDFLVFPYELTQTERDAVNLYASQLIMLRASKGIPTVKIQFRVTEEHKRQVQRVRMGSKALKRRQYRSLCANLRSLSGTIIEQQFL